MPHHPCPSFWLDATPRGLSVAGVRTESPSINPARVIRSTTCFISASPPCQQATKVFCTSCMLLTQLPKCAICPFFFASKDPVTGAIPIQSGGRRNGAKKTQNHKFDGSGEGPRSWLLPRRNARGEREKILWGRRRMERNGGRQKIFPADSVFRAGTVPALAASPPSRPGKAIFGLERGRLITDKQGSLPTRLGESRGGGLCGQWMEGHTGRPTQKFSGTGLQSGMRGGA